MNFKDRISEQMRVDEFVVEKESMWVVQNVVKDEDIVYVMCELENEIAGHNASQEEAERAYKRHDEMARKVKKVLAVRELFDKSIRGLRLDVIRLFNGVFKRTLQKIRGANSSLKSVETVNVNSTERVVNCTFEAN